MENAKETAGRVQDLLTLCLARAINMALTATRGPRWFQQFKEEESRMSSAHMIVRNYHNSINDCDFQAFLKILYYRPEYSREILIYFNHREAVYTGGRETPFHRTVGRLINDYRNTIGAHVSASMIQKNRVGNMDDTDYDYEQAIKDMRRVARVFSAVRDENGKRYYDLIRRESEGKAGSATTVVVIVVAVVAAAALAAALYFLKPWTLLFPDSFNDAGLRDKDTYVMNDSIADFKIQDFYVLLQEEALQGDYDSFRQNFTSGYTDAEIREFYQTMSVPESSVDRFVLMQYTDDAIAAFLVRGNEAEMWTIVRDGDFWKMGCTAELQQAIQDELVNSLPDRIKTEVPPEKLAQTEFLWTYETCIRQPLKAEMYLLLAGLVEDDNGNWICLINVVNGTNADITGLRLSAIDLVDEDTGVTLAEIKVNESELAQVSFPASTCSIGKFVFEKEKLQEGVNLNHTLKIEAVGLAY